MNVRPHRLGHVFSLLAGFLVLAVATGVLLAGLALPAVYGVGSAAQGGVDLFQNMPNDFAISPLAQQSKIVAADGHTVIANPYDENRIIVPLANISPWMQKAQVAIEDARFFEHGGLDLRGFVRASLSTLRGGQVQGGSTLTQQYVKITLQENALRKGDKAGVKAATEVSLKRKVQELRYALDVEQNMTKAQILSGYLNLVNYGDQAYGVEAAALNYFGIHAKQLNLSQSALLAGIVQQPSDNNPVANPAGAQARRDVVLDRMAVLGMITPAQAAAAKKPTVKSMLHRVKLGGVCQRSTEPYVCGYVLAYLKYSPQMAILGKTPAAREKAINQGGLTIQTTIRPDLQKFATQAIRDTVAPRNDNNLAAAAASVEPGTGKVLAIPQWSDYKETQIAFAVDEKYNGSNGYDIGSTAKMYALVTDFEKGGRLGDSINAPQAGPSKPYTFQLSDFHDGCNSNKPWDVRNDGNTGGKISLTNATANSVNTAFAALTIKLGGCEVRKVMTRMGLHLGNGDQVTPSIAAITLGGGTTVTPLTLANSYATLAADGTYCEPTPIESIKDASGKALKIPPASCRRVIDAQVAANVTKLLEGPLRFGTATGANWNFNRPAAGKTGTTEKHGQAWFVGYTKQISTAVWIGNRVPADKYGNLRSLNGKCFGVYGCKGPVFGGTVSAPLWGKIMRFAVEGTPIEEFASPSYGRIGQCLFFPNVVGYGFDSAKARLEAAGFYAYRAGTMPSKYGEGTVAATDPSDCAGKGTGVGLVMSSGAPPPPSGTPSGSGSGAPTPGGPQPTKTRGRH